MTVSATREQLRRTIRSDEHSVVTELLQSTPRSARSRQRVLAASQHLVTACRSGKKQFDTLDALFSEYGLSNSGGLQLMCLAESLLRVPDASTIDRLIAEKLQAGNWRAHLRGSGSALVNTRSEERRVGNSVELGGRRIIQKKNRRGMGKRGEQEFGASTPSEQV